MLRLLPGLASCEVLAGVGVEGLEGLAEDLGESIVTAIVVLLDLLACFFLFTLEILINSVVVDDFKYSFFFYLDIIATLSIVFDIPYLLYPFNALFGIPN